MTSQDVLGELRDAGVHLYLDGAKLRGRSRHGAYDERLRGLVAVHRNEIIDLLAAHQQQADAALAEVLELLRHAQRQAQGNRGRSMVLEVWATLARRWHDEGNANLFEIAAAVRAMRARWREEDNKS
jgi:hypothetical protein